MAAISWTKLGDGEDVWGRRRNAFWNMVMSSTTYVAGGMVVSGATFGLKAVLGMIFVANAVLPTSTTSYVYLYNSATGGVQLFISNTASAMVEVSGSITATATFLVISTSD